MIGGHPHWVQGWERIGSATVVHSLGNFIFDMDFQTKTREGIFVEIVLWGGQVKAVEPVPYVIDDRVHPAAGPRRAGRRHPGRRLVDQPGAVRGAVAEARLGRCTRLRGSSWRRVQDAPARGTGPSPPVIHRPMDQTPLPSWSELRDQTVEDWRLRWL